MKLIEKIMTKNPCYAVYGVKRKSTKGLMLHSVGCAQPSAMAFINNWNSASYDRACVHGFIDANDGTAYQTLPWAMRGWHGGGSSNDTHIGVEMCESAYIKYTGGSAFTVTNKAKAQADCKRAYDTAVELFAMLCKLYKLDPLKQIVSHAEGYKLGIATNHADPTHYWKGLGMTYTMDGFRKDVKKAMGSDSSADADQGDTTKKVYRVQVGAYSVKANADKMMAKVKKAGFDAIIVQAGKNYKVQVGAFGVKKNAENMLSKLKKAGFSGYITTASGEAVPAKSLEEIAREVLAGKWGNGSARKAALTKAGYDYDEVQKLVNQLAK